MFKGRSIFPIKARGTISRQVRKPLLKDYNKINVGKLEARKQKTSSIIFIHMDYTSKIMNAMSKYNGHCLLFKLNA